MRLGAGLAATLAAIWFGCANAADWKMDADGSRLEFIVTYERQAAPGVFRQFDTSLRFDPDRPADARLKVSVAITSADMNSSDANDAIRAPEWFDFARYPQAEFRATEIRRLSPRHYLARGVLRLKGVQQEIEVPFSWNASDNSAAMEGEFTLTRTSFGIGTGEWAEGDVIGLNVKVKFKVKLRKSG